MSTDTENLTWKEVHDLLRPQLAGRAPQNAVRAVLTRGLGSGLTESKCRTWLLRQNDHPELADIVANDTAWKKIVGGVKNHIASQDDKKAKAQRFLAAMMRPHGGRRHPYARPATALVANQILHGSYDTALVVPGDLAVQLGVTHRVARSVTTKAKSWGWLTETRKPRRGVAGTVRLAAIGPERTLRARVDALADAVASLAELDGTDPLAALLMSVTNPAWAYADFDGLRGWDVWELAVQDHLDQQLGKHSARKPIIDLLADGTITLDDTLDDESAHQLVSEIVALRHPWSPTIGAPTKSLTRLRTAANAVGAGTASLDELNAKLTEFGGPEVEQRLYEARAERNAALVERRERVQTGRAVTGLLRQVGPVPGPDAEPAARKKWLTEAKTRVAQLEDIRPDEFEAAVQRHAKKAGCDTDTATKIADVLARTLPKEEAA